MAITATSTVAMVREKFPQAVVETVHFHGEETIALLPEHLVTICMYLLKNQQYSFLSSVTAVDWLEREPRFDVVYHLLSIPNQSELRLKVRVGLHGPDSRTARPGPRYRNCQQGAFAGLLRRARPADSRSRCAKFARAQNLSRCPLRRSAARRSP